MGKHRTFNADRFLDKFQGNESILRGYVGIWNGRLDLDISSLDIPKFKEFLANGDGDGKDELLEGLYRAYDLCSERGHEDLLAAGRDWGYDPDPEDKLPVECLSLKVRTEKEDTFNLAYDRNTVWRAERFSLFRGKETRAIADIPAAAQRFQEKLAEVFKEDKNSDRVLVRHYSEGDYTNFIVYHEKRTKAELVFKGTKSRFRVTSTILRPAQQDFISYNNETGQVEIEARFEKEETALRKHFAECCLGRRGLLRGSKAGKRLNLARIAEEDFDMPVDEEHSAVLVELQFKMKQLHAPSSQSGPRTCWRRWTKTPYAINSPEAQSARPCSRSVFRTIGEGSASTFRARTRSSSSAQLTLKMFSGICETGEWPLADSLPCFILTRLDQIERPVFRHRELERFPPSN